MLKQSDSHVKKYLERAFERKTSFVICIYNEWTHPSQVFFSVQNMPISIQVKMFLKESNHNGKNSTILKIVQ